MFTLIFWFLFGWLADYSFPFGQALDLIFACFRGTVSARLNNLQQHLQRTDIFSQLDNKKQIRKLNNLESQAWLYEGILERLGTDPSTNHEKIARTIEALEYKRSEILQELEPRRPKKYRFLAGLQDSARTFLASQAESDYEQLQKIVTNLVIFIRSRQPSQMVVSEAINRLAVEISHSKNRISPYRLRLAYGIDELMKVLSTKLVLNSNSYKTANDYQSVVNELNSSISLLSQKFNNLLILRQEDQNELHKRVQEIADLTKNIFVLQREISIRDADIVNLRNNIQSLTHLAQEKQVQVNNLQKTIQDLQKEIQYLSGLNYNNQDQIKQLQKQLSYLNQQQISLQRRNNEIIAYAQKKESEAGDLLSEKNQLNTQNLELKQKNKALNQDCQHQQDTIARLNKQLEELARANQTKTYETRETISEEEYKEISNQNEYEFVRGHTRSGKRVKPYYRRKRRR